MNTSGFNSKEELVQTANHSDPIKLYSDLNTYVSKLTEFGYSITFNVSMESCIEATYLNSKNEQTGRVFSSINAFMSWAEGVMGHEEFILDKGR